MQHDHQQAGTAGAAAAAAGASLPSSARAAAWNSRRMHRTNWLKLPPELSCASSCATVGTAGSQDCTAVSAAQSTGTPQLPPSMRAACVADTEQHSKLLSPMLPAGMTTEPCWIVQSSPTQPCRQRHVHTCIGVVCANLHREAEGPGGVPRVHLPGGALGEESKRQGAAEPASRTAWAACMCPVLATLKNTICQPEVARAS